MNDRKCCCCCCCFLGGREGDKQNVQRPTDEKGHGMLNELKGVKNGWRMLVRED